MEDKDNAEFMIFADLECQKCGRKDTKLYEPSGIPYNEYIHDCIEISCCCECGGT